MYDRETRNSRGFGFVTFADPDVSKALLQKGNHADGVGRLNMRGKTCEVKRAEPKHPGRFGKKKFRQEVSHPPLYPHDTFVGNNNIPPYQGNTGFATYMAPMYYPFPPPMFPSTNDHAAPYPAYYMGNYNMDPLAAMYPMMPSPNPQPQPVAFLPVMPPPPPPAVAPQQQVNPSSVMQHVAPGIPTKETETEMYDSE